MEDKWLAEQFSEVRDKSKNAETPGQRYQYAAEAETYHRIKNGSLPFGTPKQSLRVYEQDDTADYGMTSARVRAIKRYLEALE
jgi:hypothetical protein